MINCITFQKRIFVFAILFIILSNSGCVSISNSQDIDYENHIRDTTIISNINQFQEIAESDINTNYDKELINILKTIEKHDYAYEKEMASETAHTVSQEMENYGLKPLDGHSLKEYGNYKSEMNKLNRILDILNEQMDHEFKHIPLDQASHNYFISLVNKGEKYLPAVDSYNELIYSSDYVLSDKTNDEYIKRFYICAFLLSVDIALIQSGGVHKGVFKSVGTLNSELKLMKSVPYLGYSGYGYLLSTIYWSIKRHVIGFKNDVFDAFRDGINDDDLANILNGVTIEDGKKQFENIDVDKSKNDLDSLSSSGVTWLKDKI